MIEIKGHIFFLLVKVCNMVIINSFDSFLRNLLLCYNCDPSPQVPLLLSIGEEDTALTKATESGDTDLIYLVLFHIWQKVLPT